MLKDKWERYCKYIQVNQTVGTLLSCVSCSSSHAQQDHIWLKKNELDERYLWEDKMNRKSLLTVIIADRQ